MRCIMAKKKSANMSVFAYWINVLSNLITAIKNLVGQKKCYLVSMTKLSLTQ